MEALLNYDKATSTAQYTIVDGSDAILATQLEANLPAKKTKA
jgi:hypothetical protein